MKSFKSVVITGLAVLIFAAAMLPAAPALAQSSAALSIVPKKNYVIEPGKTIKDTITIRNLDSTKALQLTLRVIDFTFNDDGGSPKLMLAQDAPQTTWSLKPFLTMPKSVTVAAGASKTVNLSVAIPAKLGAGSYYSAILYSSGAPDGGNVGLSASGVTLAFVSVPGAVNEKLTVEKFGNYDIATTNTAGKYTFIAGSTPKTIGYTLKNDGNVTEAPVGSITLRNLFGQEQTIDNVNPNSSLALIGQTRTFAACIKLKEENTQFNGGTAKTTACADSGLWPGYYKATLSLFYGQNGNNTKEVSSTASFWYLPWWFVLAFVVIVLALAYGIWRLVQKIKGRNFANQRKKLSRRRK